MNDVDNGFVSQRCKQPGLILFILVVAGLLGNYFRYPIFFSIDFLFGSVFVMLALQILGLLPGIFAATFISSTTYLLWNHPYAIVIMICEVLVVGLLNRRQKMAIVHADALYWLCVGMPLVFILYYGVMHLALSNAVITMLKQALNGIFNALLARMLFMAFSYPHRKVIFSLREIIFNLLALFVLISTFVIIAVQSRYEFATTEKAVRGSLIQANKRVTANLNNWLRINLQEVIELAWLAGRESSQLLQQNMDYMLQMDDGFLRLGVLDRNATVVAHSPLIDKLGMSTLGLNSADRPYVPELKRTLKPMLSEVVMGRVGTPEPIALMLAPVILDGKYGGYVVGILNMQKVKDVIALNVLAQNLPGIRYTILDKNGKVVVTNRDDLRVMTHFSRGAGEMVPLVDGISQWIPVKHKNVSISARWKQSYYISQSQIGLLSEWKLILEQPIAPLQDMLYVKYATELGLVLAILLSAMLFAEIVSRRMIKSLESLWETASGLPEKLASGQGICWDESGILETRHLVENFKRISLVLAEKFVEIRQINENLEGKVRERTRELALLSFALDHVSDEAILFDENACFLHVNESACQTLGYSREEMLGMTLSDIDPDHRPEIWPKEWQALRALGSLMFESRHRTRDGRTYPVEVSATYFEFEGVGYSIGLARDVTERKQSENRLMLLNDCLLNFGPNPADNINRLTAFAGNLMGGVYALYNRLEDGLICPIGQWQTPPDYQVTDRPDRHICQDVIRKGVNSPSIIDNLAQTDYAITDPNVSRYALKTYIGMPVFWQETAVGSLCVVYGENMDPIFANLSFLKLAAAAIGVEEARWRAEEAMRKSEERYRLIVSNAIEGIWTVDKEIAFSYVNQYLADILGYQPEELVGRSLADFIPDEELADHAQRVENRNKGISERYERRLRRKDGSLAWLLVSATPIFDTKNNYQGAFAMCTDITILKQAQEQLQNINYELERGVRKRTAELESSNRDMESFCHSISHELQAPIARLEGFSKLITECIAENRPEEFAYLAGRIEVSSQRLRTVIDALLMMNRLSLAELVKEPVDLSEMAKRVMGELTADASHRNIKVTIAPHIVAQGDYHMLDICLMNLLGNAVKYTARAFDAAIEFGQLNQSGTNVYFVRDNGAGFDMAFVNKLFQPFSRLHSGREFEGNGIGLAIVHRIIDRHGGKVWADSSLGKGATFYFTLG